MEMYSSTKNKNDMKKQKLLLIAAAAVLGIGGIMYAADHIDAPLTTADPKIDITDVYAFQAQNPNNMVFVINTQGLMSPAATATAAFNDNVMLELNIDNNNDNVEDLVIQCISSGTKMNVYGPVAPITKGTRSQITGALSVSADITLYTQAAKVTTTNGISVFAGPRDDPFFFDLTRYNQILAGTQTAFRNPGVDDFAGTNVMSVVVEVPKTMLNSTGNINVWAESKKKVN